MKALLEEKRVDEGTVEVEVDAVEEDEAVDNDEEDREAAVVA